MIFEVLPLVLGCPADALGGIASGTVGRTPDTMITLCVPSATCRVVFGTQSVIMPGRPRIEICVRLLGQEESLGVDNAGRAFV